MKVSIQYVIIVALVLTACTAPAPSPTPEIQILSRTPTLTPSQTATPSPTSTHTSTPTPTYTFTPTHTPTLTPTPRGYYVDESDAFALIYPDGWEVLDDEDDEILIMKVDESLLFYWFSQVGEQGGWVADLVTGLGEEYDAVVTPVADDEIVLKDGTTAQRATMKLKLSGRELALHRVRVQNETRSYAFMVVGPSPNVADNLDDIQTMLESIELRSEMIYGLERDRTLVLLGSDPYPEDLDPARMDGSADEYIGHLYSGLVRLSPQMQVEPDLAERWAVSADGTIYTFILRDDAAFQSGRAITAQDVKYSWERAADPETDSPTVGTYLGDIVGVRAKLGGEADEIEGVQVVDDRTLVVTLDGPKPYFLAKLTYPTSYVLDHENVESDSDEWMFKPNASGPYGLKEFQEEEVIIFERNDAYHSAPSIENVVYLLYRAGSRLSYFEAQEIDITSISKADAKAILEDPENTLNDQLHSTTSMCTSYIKLNNHRAPMDELEFRRALALAVDRERVNELFNENLSQIADSILPPAMPGYLADRDELEYDPQGAKAALEASSYADQPPEIVMNVTGYGDSDSPYLDTLIQMWRESLGVEVVIDYVDPRNAIEGLHEADGHVVVGGWCAVYPDPENFLDILFHSGSIFNAANYDNPEIDALLEEARLEFDTVRRIELYQQIETILLEDYAIIPMHHSVIYTLVNPRIEGYVLPPAGAPIVHLLSIVNDNP